MNRHLFLNLLSERLKSLPQGEIEKSVFYYDEMISDRVEEGMTEEEAVAALGTMDQIVENIMLGVSLPTLMKARFTDSKKKASSQGIWLTLFLIGSVIWFPLLLAFFAVVFALYITIWSMIVSFYAVVAAFGLSAIGCFAGGIFVGFYTSFPAGLCLFGIGFVCAALALLLLKPMFLITRTLIRFTSAVAKKVKSFFIKKEVNTDEIK